MPSCVCMLNFRWIVVEFGGKNEEPDGKESNFSQDIGQYVKGPVYAKGVRGMLHIGIQRSNLMRFLDLSAPATDALRLLVSPPVPTICDHIWLRDPRQIMISSFQLL